MSEDKENDQDIKVSILRIHIIPVNLKALLYGKDKAGEHTT